MAIYTKTCTFDIQEYKEGLEDGFVKNPKEIDAFYEPLEIALTKGHPFILVGGKKAFIGVDELIVKDVDTGLMFLQCRDAVKLKYSTLLVRDGSMFREKR